MTLLDKPVRFTDIPINMVVHPVRGDLLLTKDDQAVIQSIRNILLTGEFERRFQPEFGLGLRKFLFENLDDPNFDSVVRASIIERVSNREKRARVIEVYVRSSPDNNTVNIKLLCSINNKTEPVIIDFILERVR